jgi:hypothetical protein
LIVSLPLVPLPGMIRLPCDSGDAVRIANHAPSTLWYALLSLPMVPVLAAMLRAGIGFWPGTGAGERPSTKA